MNWSLRQYNAECLIYKKARKIYLFFLLWKEMKPMTDFKKNHKIQSYCCKSFIIFCPITGNIPWKLFKKPKKFCGTFGKKKEKEWSGLGESQYCPFLLDFAFLVSLHFGIWHLYTVTLDPHLGTILVKKSWIFSSSLIFYNRDEERSEILMWKCWRISRTFKLQKFQRFFQKIFP